MDIMQGTRQVLSVGSTPTRSVFQCFNFCGILLAAASCTCYVHILYIIYYIQQGGKLIYKISIEII